MFDRSSRLSLLLVALLASAAHGKVHVVQVGNGGFKYTPNTTVAAVGDIVQFQFYPPDHSVIRAEFTGSDACGGNCNPCVPYELYHPGAKDHFFSGLVNVTTQEISNPPKWNLTINDTKPIFFYCNAVDSCHPNGMVGVINPNKSTPLSAQFNAAKAAQYQLNPGDSFPAEGSMPSATGTVVQSPGASATGVSTQTATPHHTHHGLSGGAIAGIVIGCVVGLALFGAAVYFWGRSRTYGKIFSASQKGSAPAGSDGSTPAGGVEGWVAGQQAQHEKHESHSTAPAAPTATDPHASFISGGTQSPMHSPRPQDIESAPGGAQFVGYNRQSGAPEYSYEAPSEGHQVAELRHEKSKEKVAPVPEEPSQERVELPG